MTAAEVLAAAVVETSGVAPAGQTAVGVTAPDESQALGYVHPETVTIALAVSFALNQPLPSDTDGVS